MLHFAIVGCWFSAQYQIGLYFLQFAYNGLLFGKSLENFFQNIRELGHFLEPSFLFHHLPTFLDNQLLGGNLQAITLMHVCHHQQIKGIPNCQAADQSLDTGSSQGW